MRAASASTRATTSRAWACAARASPARASASCPRRVESAASGKSPAGLRLRSVTGALVVGVRRAEQLLAQREEAGEPLAVLADHALEGGAGNIEVVVGVANDGSIDQPFAGAGAEVTRRAEDVLLRLVECDAGQWRYAALLSTCRAACADAEQP